MTVVTKVIVNNARGPRGFASGPLGAGSVDAETISDDSGEQAAIVEKIGAASNAFDYQVPYAAGTLPYAVGQIVYFSAWPGVDHTGATDNSALFADFLDYLLATGKRGSVGVGRFLINGPGITRDVGAGLYLDGFGIVHSILARTASGDMLTLENASRTTIENIAFTGASMTTGGGLVVRGSGVGVINLRYCQFSSFPGRGFFLNGTFAQQMSSCDIRDNLVLSCGILDVTPQYEMRYVNDTEFVGNQVGNITLLDPHATIGGLHYACQAGNVGNNYHWLNIIGARYELCAYLRAHGNRWEENERSGSVWVNSPYVSFGVNHHHTNGQEAHNSFDSMVMIACGEWAIGVNSFYNFAGTTVLPRYCLSIDAACVGIVIGETTFSGYGTAPVFNAAGASGVSFSNCYPKGLGVANTNKTILSFNSGNLSAGQQSFAGPSLNGSSGNSATDARHMMGYSGIHRQLRTRLSVNPGTGKTVKTTLYGESGDTPLTLTITGPAQAGVIEVPQSFGPQDLWCIHYEWGADAATGTAFSTLQSDE